MTENIRDLVAKYPDWHHTFEIFPGIWTKGSYNPEELIKKGGLKN